MQEATQLSVEFEGHQWWFSLQRPHDPDGDQPGDLSPDPAMWCFHGPDDQVIEVRPAVDSEPVEITARRLKDWLARWIYEKASRRVMLDQLEWKVWREPGITVMSRTRGERISLPPPAGLYFLSSMGETLFVPEKLTGIRFVTMATRELEHRLALALRDQGWRRSMPMP